MSAVENRGKSAPGQCSKQFPEQKVNIKLCGMRRPCDMEYVNLHAPEYAGFVFAESKRRVTAQEAAALIRLLDAGIGAVGVFVNEEVGTVADLVRGCGLDVVQLHGDEDRVYIGELQACLGEGMVGRQGKPVEIWKAIRVREQEDIIAANRLPVQKLLFDAFDKTSYGGTGKTANWDLISGSRSTADLKPFFLAGGLNAGNLPEAIAKTAPFGVDLSSGIETDGSKDEVKIRRVIELVRTSDCEADEEKLNAPGTTAEER